MKSPETYKRQARILKAMAHETRLMIVDRLREGECSVSELTSVVGADPSTVSKHLALLRAHGLVADRREGNNVYYSVLVPCLLDIGACATRVFEERWEPRELPSEVRREATGR